MNGIALVARIRDIPPLPSKNEFQGIVWLTGESEGDQAVCRVSQFPSPPNRKNCICNRPEKINSIENGLIPGSFFISNIEHHTSK